jgi:hypothetical protein
MQAQNYPAILIAIQIAFLGWRINREIPLVPAINGPRVRANEKTTALPDPDRDRSCVALHRFWVLGDKGLRTWFPVSDYLNVLSMLAVVWFCIVKPLNDSDPGADTAKLVLSMGFALIVMHPINMIGHYRFLSPKGRHVYTLRGRDYPYITDHEYVTLLVTALLVLSLAARSPFLAHFVSG